MLRRKPLLVPTGNCSLRTKCLFTTSSSSSSSLINLISPTRSCSSSSNNNNNNNNITLNDLKTSLASLHEQLKTVQKQIDSFEKDQSALKKQQEEALEFVKSINTGQWSEQAIAYAKILLSKMNENLSAFCTKEVVENLFSLLKRDVFTKTVSTALFKILENNPKSFASLLLEKDNADSLLRILCNDSTTRKTISTNVVRCILLVMKHFPTSESFQKLYLENARLVDGICWTLGNCKSAENIQVLCQTLCDTLQEDVNKGGESNNKSRFISYLNKSNMSNLQKAILVCQTQEDKCAVMKFVRQFLNKENSSKVKSFTQLQKDALETVKSLKPGDFSAEACRLASGFTDKVTYVNRYSTPPYLQKEIVEHLFQVLRGFKEHSSKHSESREENAVHLFDHCTNTIHAILGHRPEFIELVLVKEHAESLFDIVESNKKHCYVARQTAMLIFLLAIEKHWTDDSTKLKEVFLTERFAKCLIKFLNEYDYHYNFGNHIWSWRAFLETVFRDSSNGQHSESAATLAELLHKQHPGYDEALESLVNHEIYSNAKDGCTIVKEECLSYRLALLSSPKKVIKEIVSKKSEIKHLQSFLTRFNNAPSLQEEINKMLNEEEQTDDETHVVKEGQHEG